VILAGILSFSLFFVLVNLTVDVLYAFLDPRIRYV
jgi:ABC-type dipeptide/oligopeptide/nickel transport system permease component